MWHNMPMRLTPEQAAEAVHRASAGDREAWQRLVDGYAGLIWATTRSHRLSDGDAHDVSQTTWLRLVENIDRLTEPAAVGAWLATTARRECLRLLRQSRRTVPFGDWEDLDDADPGMEDLDADLIRVEQGEAVRDCLQKLNPSCQALLHLLILDPPPSYDEISAALGMPIGSIGPTRGRCLRKLEGLVAERGIRRGATSVSRE